ncbi:MAG: aldo/keto reductase [Candidatus Poribacteria bacterium]
MQKRRLGKTGLDVTVIGFGSIKLPDVQRDDAIKIINRALDLGINFIDTARNYGDSEEKIGYVLKERRDECYIATKTASRESAKLMQDLETSLRNLQTDVIDLYQFHTVSEPETYKRVMSSGGALEGAKKAQSQGKIRHIGITIHRDMDTMVSAITSGEFETVMLAYSPLDQEGVEQEILPMAKAHDMGVITMKPLSGGLLSLPEHERETLGYDPIATGSLRYIISNENVTVAIPGITCMREIEENAKIGNMPPMTKDEKMELLKAIGSLKKEFRYGQVCLRCGYCQPCTEEIIIPTVFKAVDIYRSYPDELKYIGKNLYMSLKVKADECVECEKCMEKCPAGLNIPEKLKGAVSIFG